MKKIFVITFVAMGLFSTCATTGSVGSGEPISEPLTFSEIVDVENTSKDDLFTRINMWFVSSFRSADSVIQFSDKDSGVISGKYNADVFVGSQAMGEWIKYSSTITIEIRDNRYRITLSEPSFRTTGNSFGGPNSYPGINPTRSVSTSDVATAVLEGWTNLAKNLKNQMITIDSSNW